MYFIGSVCRRACFFIDVRASGLAAALVYFQICFVCALAVRSCWCARPMLVLPGRKFYSGCAYVCCTYVVACVVQGFASLDRRNWLLLVCV